MGDYPVDLRGGTSVDISLSRPNPSQVKMGSPLSLFSPRRESTICFLRMEFQSAFYGWVGHRI